MITFFLSNFREHEGVSPTVSNFYTIIEGGIFFGVVTGMSIHAKGKYVEFMESQRPQQYASHLDAKADLTGRIQRGVSRGALEWGIRSFAVTFTFS